MTEPINVDDFLTQQPKVTLPFDEQLSKFKLKQGDPDTLYYSHFHAERQSFGRLTLDFIRSSGDITILSGGYPGTYVKIPPNTWIPNFAIQDNIYPEYDLVEAYNFRHQETKNKYRGKKWLITSGNDSTVPREKMTFVVDEEGLVISQDEQPHRDDIVSVMNEVEASKGIKKHGFRSN